MAGKDPLTDEQRQSEFKRGQEYESKFQPLNTPVRGPCESEEHFEERETNFEAGRASVRNNK